MQTALYDFAPGVELILRIILEMPDLVVTELTVQKLLPNLVSRDLILDVHAVDSNGKHFNIEVQCKDDGAIPQRPRYHSALMDVEILQKGHKVKELPETYVVFITENDVLGAGLPVYHIDRTVKETGQSFGDGAHIVYANASYVGKDEIGHLMSDFRVSDPKDMHFDLLANHVRSVKNNRKGVIEMSKVLNEMYNEGREEGREEGFALMLSQLMNFNSWTLEQALGVSGVSLEQRDHYAALIDALPAR